MKSVFIILVFTICLALTLNKAAADYPAAPQWREICPSLYLDVCEHGNYYLPDKQYWANRKRSFEQSKNFCRHNYEYDLEKLEDCYAILKSSEMRKTKDFEIIHKHEGAAPIYP